MARAKTTEPKATEAEMCALLEAHYATGAGGNGPAYAFVRQVRNAAGFDATRTFDAVAVGLWPSRGHDIHVIEVKVSRGDWQRELANPAKADAAAKFADRFSIAAPRGIVDAAELPPNWGLIEAYGGVEDHVPSPPLWDGDRTDRTVRVVTGRKIRVVKAAPLLTSADQAARGPVAREFLVTLLRAAGATPKAVTPEQAVIDAAVTEALKEERARVAQELAEAADRQAEELAAWRQFRSDARLPYWTGPEGMRRAAAQVRAALAGAPERLGPRLETLRATLATLDGDLAAAISGIEDEDATPGPGPLQRVGDVPTAVAR